MAYQQVGTVQKPYAQSDVSDQTDNSTSDPTSKFHQDVQDTLSQTGQYPQNDSTAPGLPTVVFSNSEDFNPVPSPFNQSNLPDAVFIQHDPASTDAANLPNNGASPDAVVTQDTPPAGSDSTVVQPGQAQSHESGGAIPIVGDIIGGAIGHVFTHPMDVIQSIGTGIVLSVAAGAVVAAAAPIIATAPAWVPIAAGITLVAVGLGVTSWAAMQHGPKWLSDIGTVWDPSKHTADEVAKAHEGLKDIGGGLVDFAAGCVGGGWFFKQSAKATTELVAKTFAGDATATAAAAAKTATTASTAEATVTTKAAAAQNAEDQLPDIMKSISAQTMAGERFSSVAFQQLKDPKDIAEFGDYWFHKDDTLLSFPATIREAATEGGINSATKQTWLDLAKSYEQQAVPILSEKLAKAETAGAEVDAPKIAYYLDGLKAGKTADVIEDEWNAIDAATNQPSRAAHALKTEKEISLFGDTYSRVNPNARNDIAAALVFGRIRNDEAQMFQKLMESMPKSEAPPVVFPPEIQNTKNDYEYLSSLAAKNSISGPEIYALTSLKNESDIAQFANNYYSFGRVNHSYPSTIQKALDNNLVQPGTEEYWRKVMNELNLKNSAEAVDATAISTAKLTTDATATATATSTDTGTGTATAASAEKSTIDAANTSSDEVVTWTEKVASTTDEVASAATESNPIPVVMKRIQENMMAGQSITEKAFKTLKDPKEIAEFGNYWFNDSASRLAFPAEIRLAAAAGKIDEATKPIWMDLAKSYEQKAIPILTEKLADPAAAGPGFNAEKFAYYLDGLKAGKTADVITGEWAGISAATNYPRVALSFTTDREFASFGQTYARVNQNAQSDIQAALVFDSFIGAKRPMFEKLLETMPKSERTPIEFPQAIQNTKNDYRYMSELAAKDSLLTPEIYALTRLNKESDIAQFANNYYSYGPVNHSYATTIQKALDNGLVQPGTEKYWQEAINNLNLRKSAEATLAFKQGFSRAKDYASMEYFLRYYSEKTRDVELALAMGKVDKNLAPIWKEALDELKPSPSEAIWNKSVAKLKDSVSQLTDRLHQVPPRRGAALISALDKESMGSLFNRNEYAITHLRNEAEITEFAKRYMADRSLKTGEAMQNMEAAVRNGWVVPGTESEWNRIIRIFNSML